jgi:hypothetical protein
MNVLFAINALAFVIFRHSELSELIDIEPQFKIFFIVDLILYAFYCVYMGLMNVGTIKPSNLRCW